MKSPQFHANHLRKLGTLLESIAPEAPACLEEAATQLEILYRIGQQGGLPIIDKAVQSLVAEGHPSLAYAHGTGPGFISKLDPSKQVDKSADFNVSRN